jgi:hypothetical protein
MRRRENRGRLLRADDALAFTHPAVEISWPQATVYLVLWHRQRNRVPDILCCACVI